MQAEKIPQEYRATVLLKNLTCRQEPQTRTFTYQGRQHLERTETRVENTLHIKCREGRQQEMQLILESLTVTLCLQVTPDATAFSLTEKVWEKISDMPAVSKFAEEAASDNPCPSNSSSAPTKNLGKWHILFKPS
jgi:hypothetical protein